jgi:hypothetical protein
VKWRVIWTARLLIGRLMMLCATNVRALAEDRKDLLATALPSQLTIESGHDVRPVALPHNDFNGKYALNWKIVREDKDHISLTAAP